MLENLRKNFELGKEVFMRLPKTRRAAVLGAVALALGGFAALLIWSNQTNYQVLFSNLTQTDASEVVEKLKEKKIPYQLAANGTAVMVAQDTLYETRLALAGEGVPKGGGGVGYEIFNQAQIGATEFMQRINYQRAIQGELARTINQFKEVVSSRVHIVVPEETLFVKDQKKPSAAVVLQLKGNAKLSQPQVKSIVNLVSASVQGLEPEQVSVVDTTGRLLYDKKDEMAVAGLTEGQMEFKRKLESDYVEKIQTLLDRVIGSGRTIAKVSADLNFNREQTVEERFDPDSSTIRSSQSTEENQQGQGARAAGSPDEQFKVTAPTVVAGQGQEKYTFNRANETLNYEINKINKQVVRTPGEVQRLSVAVVLDGRYEEKPGPDGKPQRTFTPRPDEEMNRLTALIRSAVGFNQTRGDVVQVTTMPFDQALPSEAAPSILDTLLAFGRANSQIMVTVFLALLFIFFVVRPLLRWAGTELTRVTKEVEAAKLPSPEDQAAAELEDLRKKMTPKDKAGYLAQKEPELALEIVKAWLHDSQSSSRG